MAPDVGARDGWWLGALHVAGAELDHVLAAVASASALGGMGGTFAIVLALGRALVVPVLALAAADFVLGRTRSYRSAVVLVPIVLGMTCVHALEQLGWSFGDQWWVAVAGVAVASIAWLGWIRSSIPPQPLVAAGADAPTGSTPEEPS